VADTAQLILMYLVFPVWVAAGFFDWACHRRTAIATTAGLPENLFHWLLFAEIGLGLLAVAFVEINGAVLLIVAAVFLVHEFTVWVELRYAAPRRNIQPIEQMVHSFMELLPLVSLALLLPIAGPLATDFSLRLKTQPWSAAYLLGALALSLVFNVLPLAQETLACLKARTLPSPAPR
jgi:hypothetical protein